MKWLKLLLLFLLTIPALAQYSSPPRDTYSGYLGVTCPNSNTAFTIDTIGSNKIFCTPAGHAFFAEGPFGFDPNLITTTDEHGTSYQTYVQTTKYSGSISTYITQELGVMENLGWYILPTYHNSNAAPMTASVKVPFLDFEIMSAYSLVNKFGWGTGPVKEEVRLLSSAWGGFKSSTGVADYRDPHWQDMIYKAPSTGVLKNSTEPVAIAAASSATKGYVLGFSFDDSDGTHCFGAGPDFTTQPAGNNDYRCGYFALFVAATDFANSQQQEIYADGTNYWRSRLVSLMTTKYTVVSALNTAWGSSYTGFGTSGNCFGSLLPTYICPSPGAAFALGTGNGVTTTFSNTIPNTVISKWSLYVAINGVIVGGDEAAAGNMYGTGCGGMTGSINYTTGAISITCTTAPPNGQAITVGYIQNGWGIGTGLADEDCRSAHASYCGSGSGSVLVSLTGLSAGMQTDLNAYTQDLASFYSSTIRTQLEAWCSAVGFTGPCLYFGPTTLGTWTNPPDRYVIMGMCGNVDAWMSGGQGTFTQPELDFVNTYCPGQPLIEGEYRTSNSQSPFAWLNSSCTAVSTTVTCTTSTPAKWSSLAGNAHIDATSVSNPTYNASNVNFTGTSNTVTYTASGTPSGTPPTDVNVHFDDDNVGGFPSQNARCSDYNTKVSQLPVRTYTSGGIKPYLGMFWWDWYDNWAEQLNWGIETVRGNIYNGSDNSNSTQACVAPNGSFTCGTEDSYHGSPTLGNCASLIQSTSTTIDNDILALTGGGTIGTSTSGGVKFSGGVVIK